MSFAECLMYNILTQLKVNFSKEVSFPWSNKKRYDFYLEDYDCIIEIHGAQHYKGGFYKTFEEIKKNDEEKEKMAKENNIKHYIIIDCRETNEKYILNSFSSSELANIINNFNKIK